MGQQRHSCLTLISIENDIVEQGGEPIYYHGPHELCSIAGGSQNQLILS